MGTWPELLCHSKDFGASGRWLLLSGLYNGQQVDPPGCLSKSLGGATIYFYYLLVTSVGGQCCVWSGLAASCVRPLAHALPSNPGPDSPRRPPPSHPGVFLNRKGPCPPPPGSGQAAPFHQAADPFSAGWGLLNYSNFFWGKRVKSNKNF